MPKQPWLKMWARGEYNLHKMELVTSSLLTDYTAELFGRRFFGVMAVQTPDGNHGFYMTEEDFAHFRQLIADIFFKASKFRSFLRRYTVSKNNFMATARAASRAAGRATPDRLLDLFTAFSRLDSRHMLLGQWSAFYLTESVDEPVQELLSRQTSDPAEQADWLRLVLSPEKMSAIRHERRRLLKIALVPKRAHRERLLDEHARRYEWIPCINVIDPAPWTQDFFREELEKVLAQGNARAELLKLEQGFAKVRRDFQKLRQKFTVSEQRLLDRAHLLAFIKDDRDDARRRAYYYATPLYQAMARALDIAPHDLLHYTSAEIQSALATGQILSKRELAARASGYALVVEGGKIAVKTGPEYKKHLALIDQPVRGQEQSVHGITASPGLVRGQVRIVLSARELGKVKKGDILVTVTTHPDYLPAMRLASAIVTDEGGLTSHAAIVARELGIPAMVGTKIATKVFKDWDRVEVDAGKGIVRKLS